MVEVAGRWVPYVRQPPLHDDAPFVTYGIWRAEGGTSSSSSPWWRGVSEASDLARAAARLGLGSSDAVSRPKR